MDNSADLLAVNYLKLGYSKQEEGKYKDACEDYLRSIEIDPNNSKVHYLRALCLTELGLYEEAINSFGRATKLDDGKNSIYHLNLAITKSKNNDFKGAITSFSEFIDNDLKLEESNSIFLRAYLERGNAKMRENDKLGAILDWAYVIEKIKIKNQLSLNDSDIFSEAECIEGFLRLKYKKNKEKFPLDQAIYEDASNQLARERVSDKRTYDELSALSTIEKLALFDNLKMYEEWINSDYDSHLLKKKSRNSYRNL